MKILVLFGGVILLGQYSSLNNSFVPFARYSITARFDHKAVDSGTMHTDSKQSFQMPAHVLQCSSVAIWAAVVPCLINSSRQGTISGYFSCKLGLPTLHFFRGTVEIKRFLELLPCKEIWKGICKFPFLWKLRKKMIAKLNSREKLVFPQLSPKAEKQFILKIWGFKVNWFLRNRKN